MKQFFKPAIVIAVLLAVAPSAFAQQPPGPEVQPGSETPRGDVTRTAPGTIPATGIKPPISSQRGQSGGDGTQTEDELYVGRKRSGTPLDTVPATLPGGAPTVGNKPPPSISSQSIDKPVMSNDSTRPALKRPVGRADPNVPGVAPGTRGPVGKTGVVIVPRENCGTFWTQWGKDPKADSNPCPANCERGERLDAREQKTDTGMQYQANYRCNLPELAIKQPPAALREPGTPPRTNCGTFWTTKQSDPNADVNPCPANCERGELRDVRRGRSGDKLHYEMNYRCYVTLKQAPPTVQRAAERLPAQLRPQSTAPGNTAGGQTSQAPAPTQTAAQTPTTTQPPASAPAPAPQQTQQTPPPAPAPKATARLDMVPNYRAAFGSGSLTIGGNRIGIGFYPTIDASSTYGLHIIPDGGGRIRVRATVSNIQGATALVMESAEGTSTCPLVRNPGYNNFQTCDLAFELPTAREVRVTVRKPRDAVAQVTVVKFDVTRENSSGGALATAQVALSGPQTTFDRLSGARVNAAAGPVGTAAHITLNDNSTVGVNLIGAPAGTYRFRAMISNTSGPSQFSVQAPGKQSTCSIPATPGYQNATPCEVVLTVATAGTNHTVSFTKQAGGSTEATVDTVYVFQE